ncbi:MAG: large subunit ribosomal protein L24 [Candidatus Peregrinibacteria bacterium Greene0416_19]|nr:MAG: large subunit ribosomal protein L24 [Candidatus Peregrinibacteria bacterium Greene0416_19]
MKLHTGDTVVVISGKDKGKTGTIMRVLASESRVVVGGANMRTRHVRKTAQQAGRIIRYEASMHVSNVMLLDPKTRKRARIGVKFDEKGKKLRISKKSGEVVVPVKAQKKPKSPTSESSSDSSVSSASSESLPKKQPFWRKKAGPSAAEGEVTEGSHMQQDHSIPDQQVHVRAGSRGS